jgi:MFS family permease
MIPSWHPWCSRFLMVLKSFLIEGCSVTQADEAAHPPDDGPTAALPTPVSARDTRPSHDPYRALRFRDFRLLLAGACLSAFGQQMLTVALGWELYNRTGSALVLGGVGLAQIIPVILLSLPAGHVADRYSRKRIMLIAQVTLALGALGLAVLSGRHGPLLLIYGCLVAIGGAQAFNNPASTALVAQVIPADAYESAVTWRSSTGQVSAVLGPAAGGFLIGVFGGAAWVFVLYAIAALAFAMLLGLVRVRPSATRAVRGTTWNSVLDGVRFLGQSQVLLAAITLDLFAVLLGGAVTLLPIFAKDILHVGPFGFGWLRSASAAGGICMALTLAHRPPFARAGRTLLLAVAGFGVATIIFGLSRSFVLSFVMLVLIGAFDNISVVVRSTLLLVRTPDEMRGRVGAVNALFIGTSNQLGGFESGVTAQFFGPVISVVSGGIGTLFVVLLVARHWPEMRRLRTLSEPERSE